MTPALTSSRLTARKLDELTGHLAEAHKRLQAARVASGKMRRYHTAHMGIHLEHTLDAGHQLAGHLREHYPAEGAELNALTKTIGLARSLSPAARSATSAHLLASAISDTAHAARHAQAMLAAGTTALWNFNADHVQRHLASARDHARRLREHLADNYGPNGD